MKKINTVSIIILAFATLLSCGQRSTQETNSEDAHAHDDEIALTGAQMKAVDIRLGKIERRDLNNIIRVNGQLALDPQKKAEVTSLLGGVIKQALVTEGKYVTAGQTVAYLENTEIVELQKNYLVLKKETLMAEQEYNRQKELFSQSAGIEKTLQQATAAYEITKAQLSALEKQLQQLAINPEQVSGGKLAVQIPLKAPISGYVNKIYVSTGSYVDRQTSLMSITDNAGIHCDLNVFEKDVNHIAVGQEVDITLTNQPSIRLTGRIYEINNSFEEDTHAIPVHVSLPAKPSFKLLPGMYVTGSINTGKQQTEAVPSDAIVNKNGKKYLFVLEEETGETFHFTAVEVITGLTEGGYTQITPVEPLEEESTVVISNAFYLSSMSADHGEHGH
ncbi:MAG: efflux RND transporter periplasmic adaptor subunit [Dysgonamonadaceae bacterium]|jgi:cobalt-zinc-cadmium efflux system membrane fusion protein|nr:efflux RND transporter periplasmic adaptor subunit [Dysgonamonadaceae bacterium]